MFCVHRTGIVLLAVFALARIGEAQTPKSVVVRAEVTALRATASMSGSVVTDIKRGTELEVLGEEGSFYRVRVSGSGQEGFVPKIFVEAGASGTLAPPPTGPPTGPPPSTQAPTQTSQQTSTIEPPSDRTYFIRPFGGLFNIASTTGTQLGAGVAGRPFSNERLEIQGDFSWIRISEVNAFDFSANTLYNFKLASESFTPYAGGGLSVVNARTSAFSGSEFALQLLGGLEAPLNDRRAFRGELRIGFFEGASALSVLAGLSF
jgi:Bacterial SH3 domain